MENFLETVKGFSQDHLLQILVPIVILAVGWLLAVVLSRVTRAALARTSLDEKLAGWIVGEARASDLKLAHWLAKAVYYIVLLFTLLAFFQYLGLSAAAEPINAFLEKIFVFAPRLLGAAVILLIAWIVATVLKRVVSAVLERSHFVERIEEGGEEGDHVPTGGAIADTVYWLTFLLFLPAILSTLEMRGLLDPVKGMVDKLLNFMPNLISAGIIFFVGWFVAGLVRKLVTNLMVAAGSEKFSSKVGLDKALGHLGVAGLVGLLVKLFILVPVAIAALNALQLAAVTEPASQMLEMLLTALPSVFGAALVLAISYIVGRAVASVVKSLLAGLGFDNILVRLGVAHDTTSGERSTPSSVAGALVLVVVMLLASITAAQMLGFEFLAEIIRDITELGGRILMGLIVFGIGLFLSELASKSIAKSSISQSRALAVVARIAILILAGSMALRQMGLANDIIHTAFSFLLGSVAIAAALAFGLGGRETASRLLDDWQNKRK